ncbi:MAG: hypothetical protein ACW97G_11455 [Candidatus Thorarchaeota archaeon]
MPKTAKKRRKKRGEGPMPSGGAGLIRFFEDETPGINPGRHADNCHRDCTHCCLGRTKCCIALLSLGSE